MAHTMNMTPRQIALLSAMAAGAKLKQVRYSKPAPSQKYGHGYIMYQAGGVGDVARVDRRNAEKFIKTGLVSMAGGLSDKGRALLRDADARPAGAAAKRRKA